MNRVVIDIETVSALDLKKVGLMNYAKHESTHISMIAASMIGDDKTCCIVDPKLAARENCPKNLLVVLTMIKESKKLVAHNSPFEREVLGEKLIQFFKACGVDTEDFKLPEFVDTMTWANVFRAPAALKLACKYFGLDEVKDELGSKVMRACCTLRKDEPRNKKTKAIKIDAHWVSFNGYWAKAGAKVYDIIEKYCIQDVKATKDLYIAQGKRLHELGDFVDEVKKGIETTDIMNQNGVHVNMQRLERLVDAKDDLDDKLDEIAWKQFGMDSGQKKTALTKKINSHILKKLGRSDLIEKLGSIQYYGACIISKDEDDLKYNKYLLKGMSKPFIMQFIKHSKKEKLNNALLEYTKYNKSCMNKAVAAMNTQYNHKLYGLFKFAGAYATGRWTSFGVQLQNLPRPTVDLDDVKSMDFSSNPEVAASAIRTMLVPGEGKKFFCADLSQIELRRNLHKSGYQDKLEYLMNGGDLYVDMANDINTDRYGGKQVMLSAQFGQGHSMYRQQMFDIHGIDVSEDDAKKHIDGYRKKYKNVTKQWEYYNRLIANYKGGDFIVELATGRWLNYGKLRQRNVIVVRNGKRKRERNTYYWDGKKWKKIYGSYVYQNVIQAECRDIMLIKLNAFRDMGYRLVMTVHDEVIAEVNENEDLEKLKTDWDNAGKEKIEKYFKGLPIASDCAILDWKF